MMISSKEKTIKKPKFVLTGMRDGFEKSLQMARERMFSLAAGNRMGMVAPRIMEIGYAKVLYAAMQYGADIDGSKTFVLFAPDGTCSLNIERTHRGFSYGGLLDMNFDGMIATNNSMPNGCGFSVYKITEEIPDTQLVEKLEHAQKCLGEEQLRQLGKGNHFAAVYIARDPVSGEDTGERLLVVHCSGHAGGDRLYHPETWLSEVVGYNVVETPHGPITLLEGEARARYESQYAQTERINSQNRDVTAEKILNGLEFELMESITHQGLMNLRSQHLIGTQRYSGLIPIAFNPEEGLIAVYPKSNLRPDFIDTWEHGQRVKDLGLYDQFVNLNITPHGGGYELRFPLESLTVNLGPEGIASFDMKLSNWQGSFETFRHVRELLTYRRKYEIMREIIKLDMVDVHYQLDSLKQVYPLVSRPGGEQ